jgi:hypothetical protein
MDYFKYFSPSCNFFSFLTAKSWRVMFCIRHNTSRLRSTLLLQGGRLTPTSVGSCLFASFLTELQNKSFINPKQKLSFLDAMKICFKFIGYFQILSVPSSNN